MVTDIYKFLKFNCRVIREPRITRVFALLYLLHVSYIFLCKLILRVN